MGGRDCCPDDAGGCTYSNAGDAGDADGRTRNGWRRLRNASDAGDADGRTRRLRDASDAGDADGRTRNWWRRLRNASDADDADGRTRRLRNASDAWDSLILCGLGALILAKFHLGCDLLLTVKPFRPGSGGIK